MLVFSYMLMFWILSNSLEADSSGILIVVECPLWVDNSLSAYEIQIKSFDRLLLARTCCLQIQKLQFVGHLRVRWLCCSAILQTEGWHIKEGKNIYLPTPVKRATV